MARRVAVEPVKTDVRRELRERFVAQIARYDGVSLVEHSNLTPVVSLAAYWRRWVDQLDAGLPVFVSGIYLRAVPGCRRGGFYRVDAVGLISEVDRSSFIEEGV